MCPVAACGCRTLFSILDECTQFFPRLRQTRAANAGAFEDQAVLDFCDCRMRLSQGNYSLLTSLFKVFLIIVKSSRV